MTQVVMVVTVAMGALGALVRWGIGLLLPTAPWWSLAIVNTLGSTVVGVLAGLPETPWTYPVMMGFAGGLTTFSALAIMMVPEHTSAQARRILAPLALHIVIAVAACAGGFIIARALL